MASKSGKKVPQNYSTAVYVETKTQYQTQELSLNAPRMYKTSDLYTSSALKNPSYVLSVQEVVEKCIFNKF